MPGKNKDTKSSSISRNLHWVTRPSASIRDLALWGADVLGAPSHITNAVRDVSNRVANLPIIGLDAAYNYATGNNSTWEDAFKEADTNPSALASAFEVFPITNTESNYSDAQLANQYELRKHSPGKPGQITHDGYRYINQGRYAGDIGTVNFFSPSKVNEWSIGQTSGIADEEGNTYTSDLFAYDTKDTNNAYLKAIKEGKASPAMFLRGALGVVGAKGYDDGTNSATAIRTKIDTKAQKRAYDGQNKKAEGGSLRSSWNDLSLAEKSEMMKVAIKNGITDLSTIRQKYNEFAEGGPEDELTPWPALNNVEYIAVPDTAFTREKTGAGSIEVMFKDTPKEGYEYNTGYKYPHPKPGHNVIIYNPKENDAQDIRLDALHFMPQDPTYDVLRSELAYYADDSDIANNARNRMNEDIAKYGHPIPGMEYQDYYNNEVDGFLRNMFIEGTPEYIESKRYYPDKQQLREWNEPLMPYVDRIYDYLTTNKRPANVLPVVTIEASRKKSLGGPLVNSANYYPGGGLFHRLMRFTPRKRPNTSPTKEKSEKLENQMLTEVIKHQQENKGSLPDYDIPFIPDKAILIDGSTTSTNVLDSLAKYAGEHNKNPQLSSYPIKSKSSYGKPRQINMNEMIGLSTQESHNGAIPYFNMNGNKEHDRVLGNSNYFTAFGSIPADNLMRNFQYVRSGANKKVPPILDAFQYYAQGDYNTGSSTHTEDVNAAGRRAWQNPKVREWWEESGKYWYNTGKAKQ